MTLIDELDLAVLQMYSRIPKNEVSGLRRLSKVKARTGQTDRRDRTHYHAVFAHIKYTFLSPHFSVPISVTYSAAARLFRQMLDRPIEE